MSEFDILQHRFDTFRSLMPHRIREILLVSSVYDAYVLEEDGSLEERIWEEYMERGLSSIPHMRKVSSVVESLAIIDNEKIDLVLTIVHDDEDLALELIKKVKEKKPDLPVAMLVTDPAMLVKFSRKDSSTVDKVFLWQNDPSLLLAIVKSFEDCLNVAHDTREGKVRVILLVEDSVSHYSSFLPMMYTAIMGLTRSLMDDGLNYLHRQLRMRSRAKILLVDNYEDAIELYKKYRHYLLGVVTDVRFWNDGELDAEAGIKLVTELREDLPALPICIQSAEPGKNRQRAADHDAHFLDKNSQYLVEKLESWLMEFMGFGDFIFRNSEGGEICRASSSRKLLKCLKNVPIEVVLRHAKHQDFSHWMMARTEMMIAERLYPAKVEEFSSDEEIREFLINTIETALYEKQSDVITHFSPENNPRETQFMRLGKGSLGGKARGISFLRYFLSRLQVRSEFTDISIEIPPTVVVCSDYFKKFMKQHDLWDFALSSKTDHDELKQRFLDLPMPDGLENNLRSFLEYMNEPLAVRSSSILEDSRHLPLAGLYSTYMLRNNEEDFEKRLDSLVKAVKRIWASTFGDNPKSYFKQSSYRLKDERMSVIIQSLGGAAHGEYFYPTFSGVAQSHNFYPVSYMRPEHGVAQIALGFGKTVVEGGSIVRFCPKYPQILPQFAKIRDWLYFTQKEFYALSLDNSATADSGEINEDDLESLSVQVAEEDGVLQHVASVYQGDSDLLVDSFFYEGPRIVTFMKVLRDPNLRLGELLGVILRASENAMRTPVEIEFAVDLKHGAKPVVYLLQLRPMASKQRWEKVHISKSQVSSAVCYSNQAHGNGIIKDIKDIVFVKRDSFEKSKSKDIASEIGLINQTLVDEERPYLLVGFGRWGSIDPYMGIGVKWSQISGVRVLVEVGLSDFNVDPAQGTHFFQNVTSLNIGCLSVPHGTESHIDWEWLDSLPVKQATKYLKHVQLDKAMEIRIDGQDGNAVIVTE